MTQKGWECPRCGEVYGPQVAKCTNVDCKPKRRIDATPGGDDAETLGEAISGDDLHDVLYRETIVFPDSAPSKKRRGGGGGGQSDGSSGVF